MTHERTDRRMQRKATAPVALALLLATACGGGGGDDAAAAAQQMTLPSVSVTQGQTWRINRPIQFTFSQPVDFNTVDQTTISIAQANGQAAIGTFLSNPKDPRIVVFQPACPTLADLSDSGLQPGKTYRIRVGDVNNSSEVVMSTAGVPLQAGTNRTFVTPSGTDADELFIDLVPGAPSPRVRPVSDGLDDSATYMEVGLDDTNRTYFERDAFGNGELPAGQLAPLNLYSQVGTRIVIVVEFDQAVNPLASNVNADRLFLQYLKPGQGWIDFESSVELVENCSLTGAKVRVTPVGVLPQDADMRVVVSSDFEDLVGNSNDQPLVNFARLETAFFEEGGTPVEFGDEVRADFAFSGDSPESLEDTDAVLDAPPGLWGDGQLRAGFDFDGTGGPGGDFDWHVPANTDFVFDTTQTVIAGGPDGLQTTFLTVLDGKLDIQDLVVPATSSILIQGNQPAEFLLSGTAQIDGRIACDGANATSVFTLNTPFQPESGGAGRAGGGSGGTGSFQTTGITRRGGNGEGAFKVPGAGGEGGESGWRSSGSATSRRGGGGGGGVLGKDVQVENTITADGECHLNNRPKIPDQAIIGLDGEDGFPGSSPPSGANSAVDPTRSPPYGGRKSIGPFDPVSADDDFFGLMRKDVGTPDERPLRGELERPTAGAGGGAGGDAILAPSSFPPDTLVDSNNDKGAGGGGGAGSFSMEALGDIVFGPNARVSADGGNGNGGENVFGWDRIGAGSGGGSGGHIVIQTASRVDFSAAAPGTVVLSAIGGQGGTGDPGGSGFSGGQGGGVDQHGMTTPARDARHEGPSEGDNPFSPTVCNIGSKGIVDAAGGDGGPGLIQIHVGKIPVSGDPSSDVIPPGNDPNVNLYSVVKPPPLGYDNIEGEWVDQPLPFFGRFSKSSSKWIPLGEGAVDPLTGASTPITFQFDGTDPATGLVETGLGAVQPLPALLAPAADVSQPGLPEIAEDDPRTLMMDASTLAGPDRVYARNPSLLVGFELAVGLQRMTVASATHDEMTDVLSVTVSSDDLEIPNGGLAELIPRYFRVRTNGVLDALPDSSEIMIEFQAAPRNVLGNPDGSNATPWVTDIEDLNTAPNNADLRFLRFRVAFDIAAQPGDELNFDTPRPALDFLTVTFRF